jgi:hypothetical protein
MDEERKVSVHAHPFEAVSLVIGVVLLVLGLTFAVADVDITRVAAGWIWFGILATIGLLLVAFAWRRHKALADERKVPISAP